MVVQLQGTAIDSSTRRLSLAEEFRQKNPQVTQIAVKFNLMLAIEYARKNSFKKIALVPGALNYSALNHEERGDISLEEHQFNISMAKRIYDVAARQLKFNLFDPHLSGYHTLELS